MLSAAIAASIAAAGYLQKIEKVGAFEFVRKNPKKRTIEDEVCHLSFESLLGFWGFGEGDPLVGEISWS